MTPGVAVFLALRPSRNTVIHVIFSDTLKQACTGQAITPAGEAYVQQETSEDYNPITTRDQESTLPHWEKPQGPHDPHRSFARRRRHRRLQVKLWTAAQSSDNRLAGLGVRPILQCNPLRHALSIKPRGQGKLHSRWRKWGDPGLDSIRVRLSNIRSR